MPDSTLMSGRTVRPHASFIVVAQMEPTLDARESQAVAVLAQRLSKEEPHLSEISFMGPSVRCGVVGGPGLFFEDHSELELSPGQLSESSEYRIRLLAGDGDLVLTGSRHPSFEAYCRDWVGLGAPRMIHVGPSRARPRPLAARAAADPEVLAALAQVSMDAGRLTLFPYFGGGSAWQLAGNVARQAGVTSHVAAPPPTLTRRANDKVWFSRCVEELLGPTALPPGHSVYGAGALAARVRALARHHQKVVVKVPSSASGSGNITIDSRSIAGLPLVQVRDRILAALHARGWGSGYPLLVSVWECAAQGSPSVQTWIPHREDGTPLIEGVFDQVLQGEHGEFVGAEPSLLPSGLRERLAHEALLLASFLQRLGYYGRCSFDALITGADLRRAGVHWVDCNARWGGVSLPMSLVNRLTGDWSRHSFVVVHHARPRQGNIAFDDLLARLSPVLYRPDRVQGIVLTTPGTEAPVGVLDFVSLGSTQEAARAIAQKAIAAL